MSSSACVIFFGVRYEPSDDELEALEARSHPLMTAAREAGLKHYWANFGPREEKYFLFLGTQIGIFGPENLVESATSADALKSTVDATSEKLTKAAIPGVPNLWVQWLP